MNREMEHINVLAGEIGYRVATTEGEHRAANYIEQELHNYGLQEVRQEAFRSSSEGVSGFFPYILALIGSSLIAPLAPRLGLGGMLASPAMLIGELRSNRGPLTSLMQRGSSHNVIGILPAKGERKARVVLMAHYDSVRVRGYMKPSQGKSPRRFLIPLMGLSYLTALAAAAVGIFARRKQTIDPRLRWRRSQRQRQRCGGLIEPGRADGQGRASIRTYRSVVCRYRQRGDRPARRPRAR